MSLVQQLSDMTIAMESGTDDRHDTYFLLLRAMLEIRRLTQQLVVLKDKEKT